MKRVDKTEALRIGQKVIEAGGFANLPTSYKTTRQILEEEGIGTNTQILVEAWPIFLKLAMVSYKPTDLGRFGKHKEVVKRLRLKAENGVRWTTYSEFFAHKQSEADYRRDGIRIESKTGCGNFNYCRYGTIEQMRREYERKDEILEWDYKKCGIYVQCTWKQFFDYLEGYGKGLETWYKEIVPTTKGYAFVLQSIKNSKPKLTYLQEWELNTFGK